MSRFNYTARQGVNHICAMPGPQPKQPYKGAGLVKWTMGLIWFSFIASCLLLLSGGIARLVVCLLQRGWDVTGWLFGM